MLRRLTRKVPSQEAGRQTPYGAGEPALRAERDQALRDRTDADQRLRQAEALLRGAGSSAPDLASGEVWALRPSAWEEAAPHTRLAGPASGTEVAPGLRLFHDAQRAELLMRQTLCTADAPAPFALELDMLHFDGSFLSLCAQLAPAETGAFGLKDILHVELDAAMEEGLAIYARLNIVQGPNTHNMLAQFPFTERHGRADVAFELAHSGINNDTVDDAWLDLIFEKPAMNAVKLRDLRLSCKTRAEF